MSNLFLELRRRSVFRVAAAYLVGAWILLQIADALFPALNLPDWTTRLVGGLVVLGFPVALFFAWAFEVTPDGVVRDSGDSSRSESTSNRLNVATLIGVVIVALLFVWDRFEGGESRTSAESEIVETSLSPSIAVLAFENMSPDPDNAFFAEGISEEILNVLAGIDQLQVASRTSAFSFANSDTPIPAIASALSVNHVLEGSVRKQGTRVRITAQLIDAGNDKHLWSNTYERELDDIFVVQEEIANAISQALLGALGMQSVSVDVPTTDMVAYELYLSGRKNFYLRGEEELNKAIVELSTAVARDPKFAGAWSFLAAALATWEGYVDSTAEERTEKAKLALHAAEQALQLDPTQALAIAIQAQLLKTEHLEALSLLRKASAMAPNDAGILMWLADSIFRSTGDLNESLPLFERAVELDPLSGINQGVMGVAYLMAGQRELGRQYIRRAHDAGWSAANQMLLLDYFHTQEADAAIEWVEYQRLGVDVSAVGPELLMAYDELVARIAAGAATATEVAEFEQRVHARIPDASFLVEYILTDDLDTVFDQLQGIGGQHFFLRLAYSPAGLRLVEHPRFIEILTSFGYTSVWEELGYPFDCERVSSESGDHFRCPNWPE